MCSISEIRHEKKGRFQRNLLKVQMQKCLNYAKHGSQNVQDLNFEMCARFVQGMQTIRSL